MFKRLLALTALTLLVSGCGYRGALYLPDNTPQNAPQSEPQQIPSADSGEN